MIILEVIGGSREALGILRRRRRHRRISLHHRRQSSAPAVVGTGTYRRGLIKQGAPRSRKEPRKETPHGDSIWERPALWTHTNKMSGNFSSVGGIGELTKLPSH